MRKSQVGLMLNVKRADLDAVLAVLARAEFADGFAAERFGWVAVNTIVEERVAREVIPQPEGCAGAPASSSIR